ncbi:hypothetical protein HELRODRAFT_160554 [Helobdella robusta]|uniref:Uncharacterized protein n=1 Tax=Helobdella robusta TaxID=6412 RepID=T1EQE9_HELRO|nr:hypothetical protein HELRODRAFT_160554 [Helobdella robusta]ESO06386.1 hypothetical protein HELRODRAFT_160554 [Helobdella robusta]
MKKYGNALPSMEFLPICIEVLGPMDPNTLKFLKEIGKMISVRSGDSRELFFATTFRACCSGSCVGRCLGLDSAAKLALSAFLASAAATVALQDLMLSRDGIYVDNFRMQVYDMWRATNGDVVALEKPSQKHWIAPCLNRSVDRWLQMNGSTFDKARIMAVKTRSDDSCVRVSLGLRLGAQIAGIPVIKEPIGLIEEGAFRLDGYTITPWAQGRFLAWDVTLPHTMADRYIGYTSVEAGTAALKASDFKNKKYVSLNNLSKIFQPICIETDAPKFGPGSGQYPAFFQIRPDLVAGFRAGFKRI